MKELVWNRSSSPIAARKCSWAVPSNGTAHKALAAMRVLRAIAKTLLIDSSPRLSLVVSVTVSQFVSIQSGTAETREGTNRCTLLTADQPTDGCTCTGTYSHRQLVAMLRPEASALWSTVIVVDTSRSGRCASCAVAIYNASRTRNGAEFTAISGCKAIRETGLISDLLLSRVELSGYSLVLLS